MTQSPTRPRSISITRLIEPLGVEIWVTLSRSTGLRCADSAGYEQAAKTVGCQTVSHLPPNASNALDAATGFGRHVGRHWRGASAVRGQAARFWNCYYATRQNL